MELSYIKEFVTLAEEKQYLAASKKLFISQSALSRHIQALEKELGHALFTRTTRDVELSDEGRVFLPFALNIIDNYSDFLSDLYEFEKQKEQITTIGIVHNPDKWEVVRCLDEFSCAYPHVKIYFFEACLAELREKLDAGELHVITTSYPTGEPVPKNYIPCGLSKLCAMIPSDNPLSKKEFVTLDDLKNYPLFLPQEKHVTYKYFMRAMKDGGVTANVVYKGSAHGIKELVKNQKGVIVQDKFILQDQQDNNFVIKDISPAISYYYGIEYSDNLNGDESLFVKFIRQRCKDRKFRNMI